MISIKAILTWLRLLSKDYAGIKKQIHDANPEASNEDVEAALRIAQSLPADQGVYLAEFTSGAHPKFIADKYGVTEDEVMAALTAATNEIIRQLAERGKK